MDFSRRSKWHYKGNVGLFMGEIPSRGGGVDGDDDGFGGRCVAFVRHAVDGDEHVGFGEISRRAGAGNGVGDHDKM